MIPEPLVPPPETRNVSRHASTLIAILSLAMGGAFILGGPQRVSTPLYELITTQGGCYVWGSIFFLIGALVLGTTYNPIALRWVLLTGAVAYLVLAIAFTVAAFRYPDAGITASVAYGWISVVHVFASERARTGPWRTSSIGHP